MATEAFVRNALFRTATLAHRKRSGQYPQIGARLRKNSMSRSTVSVSDCTPWLRGIVACLALLVAPGAFAASNLLYKCVTAAGVTSIQSVPCPKGSTEAWHRDATPEPPPTPEQVAQAEEKLRRDRREVRELSEIVDKRVKASLEPNSPEAQADPGESASARAAAAAEQASVDACQNAQAFAGAVREKAWLGLTEDQTRRLYTWVAEQCKVPAKSE
jgi:hypothetical protein